MEAERFKGMETKTADARWKDIMTLQLRHKIVQRLRAIRVFGDRVLQEEFDAGFHLEQHRRKLACSMLLHQNREGCLAWFEIVIQSSTALRVGVSTKLQWLEALDMTA